MTPMTSCDATKTCTVCNKKYGTSEYIIRGEDPKEPVEGLCFDCRFKKMIFIKSKLKIQLGSHYHWAKSVLEDHKGAKKKDGSIRYTINIAAKELAFFVENVTECKLCGKKFDWGNLKGTKTVDKPSLDRTDNSDVISKDTIQITCVRCNWAKSNMSNNEFIQMCKNIAKKHSDKELGKDCINQAK